MEIRGAGVSRGGRRVLAGADLVLEPGTLTVAAGPGATALLDVAAGLAPARGSVRFDGVDVRRLPADRVASAVAVVTRRPFVVAGSIRENVTLGGAYDDAEVSEALRIAALPEAGDPARHRSRIGLARAVLRRPGLLVLDEATATLPPDVERRLLESLTALGLTVLASTTRPAPFADQVVHLHEGRISVRAQHRRPAPVPAATHPIGASAS
ncbi:ATP-binding cassette domain-containing protein [Paractinoplanes maris]|uniref:ATP-binding cassette domain-containing protein n=1 Tax=Paractinoplanes maris TaxID=1734446 RepID=UPI0020218F9E|nr:ATP-binding cassette domain-containing protein [Actinoplanes maris]